MLWILITLLRTAGSGDSLVSQPVYLSSYMTSDAPNQHCQFVTAGEVSVKFWPILHLILGLVFIENRDKMSISFQRTAHFQLIYQ